MGTVKEHPPVMLILGMIAREEDAFSAALHRFMSRFGAPVWESPPIPFAFTDYYEPEMGSDLVRRFAAFGELIRPEDLTEIKLMSNALEEELSAAGRRRINLDPGYLCAGKLVLASTKDNQHRIYVGHGIFHEITLRYRHGSFRPWEWTFPDYASEGHIALFNALRAIYLERLRAKALNRNRDQAKRT
jgi:hypothetical protein